MSSVLEHIEANPQETQRLIGLKYPELQILLQNAEQLHHEQQALLESRKIRMISGGGGRKPKLSIKEQIIFTLVYLRHMTTFQLLGIQFGVSESTANDKPFGQGSYAGGRGHLCGCNGLYEDEMPSAGACP